MSRKPISTEALIDLQRRLDTVPSRSPERRRMIQHTAELYGVSEYTLYRVLRANAQPRALQRADSGVPRVLPKSELEEKAERLTTQCHRGDRNGRRPYHCIWST